MNKNIIALIGLVSIIAIGSLISCKKNFLVTNNPNQLTETQFWKTESDVLSAVASVYSPLRVPLSGYWGAFRGFQDINAMGDDVYTIPGEEPATWQMATFVYDSKNDDVSSIFSSLYKAIYRANLVLANVGKVPMDASKTTAYIAETRFLRGLCYFELASNFGDVPLKTTPVVTASDEFVASSPMSAIYQQAIADLTAAAAGLPATRPSADLGRATSGAALAFLGKTYLYIKDYANAEKTLAQLYSSPYNYTLTADYEDNFTDKNEFNTEAIFQWVYGAYGSPYNPWGEEGGGAGMYNYRPQLIGPPAGGGWFKYVPSNFLLQEFVKELRPIGSDTKFDKRMYGSLTWDYSAFGETPVKWYGGSESFDDLWSSAETKMSRFYPAYPLDTINPGKFLIKKFTSAWSSVAGADNYWGATPSTANVEVMRFAEVLLLHAEAAVQVNKLSDAVADLNQIRTRAGLPAKTATDLPDGTSIMAELQHQKILELFFEQNRWNDLKRWYTPSDLSAYMVSVNKQGGANIQAKHYVFPIPASELQTNNKIVQNPLWK